MMTAFRSALALSLLTSPVLAEAAFSTDFETLPDQDWSIANYDFSHPSFDTDWRRSHVGLRDGLTLTLSPQHDAENGFIGASIRRKETSHFGRYEVVMQPAKGKGLVTGFFTYTGPYYGARHDEIDIEFLGKDTTKMHVAWFVDGVLHERDIPLGFDAALAPRRYGFTWAPDYIEWTVDDAPIFRITQDEAPIPREPGMLFLNLWAADITLANWAGLTAPTTRAKATAQSVRFVPWTPPRGLTS